MEMRDLSNLSGVARAKSANDIWEHKRSLEDEGSVSPASFAHPARVIEHMNIDGGMRVADFGAGTGAYTLPAAEKVGKTGRVYAVEVQKDLVSKIKNEAETKGFKNVDVIWGNFEQTGGSKLKDGSVDTVILSNVLFQLDDKTGALREAHRVLRDGGAVAIVDWSDSFGNMGPHKNDVVTKAQAFDLAGKVGFTAGREFDAGGHHYGLLFRKPLHNKQGSVNDTQA